MSWHVSYSSREAFEKDDRSPGSSVDTDANDQFVVARAAAAGVIAVGAVGGEGKDFSVSLAGHANPRHEPRSGWANDCVTITVSQKSAE